MNREEAIEGFRHSISVSKLDLKFNKKNMSIEREIMVLNSIARNEMAIKALEQEPSEDCVSRTQAIEFVNEVIGGKNDLADAIRDGVEAVLSALPPVTPTRKKGKWIGRKKIGFGEWEDVTVLVNPKGCVTDSVECSNCGNWLTGSDEYECDARYCPNCGAEMESEE